MQWCSCVSTARVPREGRRRRHLLRRPVWAAVYGTERTASCGRLSPAWFLKTTSQGQASIIARGKSGTTRPIWTLIEFELTLHTTWCGYLQWCSDRYVRHSIVAACAGVCVQCRVSARWRADDPDFQASEGTASPGQQHRALHDWSTADSKQTELGTFWAV